jgi:hypothetical protein
MAYGHGLSRQSAATGPRLHRLRQQGRHAQPHRAAPRRVRLLGTRHERKNRQTSARHDRTGHPKRRRHRAHGPGIRLSGRRQDRHRPQACQRQLRRRPLHQLLRRPRTRLGPASGSGGDAGRASQPTGTTAVWWPPRCFPASWPAPCASWPCPRRPLRPNQRTTRAKRPSCRSRHERYPRDHRHATLCRHAAPCAPAPRAHDRRQPARPAVATSSSPTPARRTMAAPISPAAIHAGAAAIVWEPAEFDLAAKPGACRTCLSPT